MRAKEPSRTTYIRTEFIIRKGLTISRLVEINFELVFVGLDPKTDNTGVSRPESTNSWEILAVVDSWAALRSIILFESFVLAFRREESLGHSCDFSNVECGELRKISPARHRINESNEGL